MKTTPIHTLLLLLSAGIPSGLAAGFRVDNVQPKYAVVGSPEVMAQVRGATPKRPRPISANEPAPTWLEFEADFDAMEDFPELVFKYSIILKFGQARKLIEGEVTHVDIPKGKDRHSVIYLPPKTLNKLSEGKPFTANNVLALWVEVFAAGELVGGKFKSPIGITSEMVAKEKDAIPKAGDLFLNKSQTPFAPLNWDYYEAVKPSNR